MMGKVKRSSPTPWFKSINSLEGYGNPLQYSCLESLMDRGAWRATVYIPGENARSWGALGEARSGQSSLSAGALRYRAWAQSWSSAALAQLEETPETPPSSRAEGLLFLHGLDLLMNVKEESVESWLKVNIQKTKIMAPGPITSWQIDGETVPPQPKKDLESPS